MINHSKNQLINAELLITIIFQIGIYPFECYFYSMSYF